MIKCLVNGIRHGALMDFPSYPCVVNDRSVFIRVNVVLSSIVVLIFAFILRDLRWQIHVSASGFYLLYHKYFDII